MREGRQELPLPIPPRVGDVVKALYATGERRVTSVSDANIVYLVPAAAGGWWERNCLPVTWARWCRRKGAFVEYNERT